MPRLLSRVPLPAQLQRALCLGLSQDDKTGNHLLLQRQTHPQQPQQQLLPAQLHSQPQRIVFVLRWH